MVDLHRKKSKHDEIKFDCDQCNDSFTTKNNLTILKQSKHEGIKYDCDQCDGNFTKQDGLTIHK